MRYADYAVDARQNSALQSLEERYLEILGSIAPRKCQRVDGSAAGDKPTKNGRPIAMGAKDFCL
jgi:hypothetical protein